MPPAIAPMQNGTSTDERANAAPKMRRKLRVTTALRKAKLAPRNTMPSAAIASGTNMVSVIDWYTAGNAVQVRTKMKISHTWLASHTGPIERSTRPLGAAPCSAPPAVRSQKPAPKSAPPNSA
jgi:hypothetical protein